VLVSDLIARGFDPLALRLSFLESRYRTQLDLSWAAIAAAHKTIARWRLQLTTWRNPKVVMTHETSQVIDQGLALLQEDLNSPALIQLLRKIEKDEALPLDQRAILFDYFDQFLGLDLTRQEVKESSAEINELLRQREDARGRREWKQSDELREALAELGIEVRDSATGQAWEWSSQ